MNFNNIEKRGEKLYNRSTLLIFSPLSGDPGYLVNIDGRLFKKYFSYLKDVVVVGLNKIDVC